MLKPKIIELIGQGFSNDEIATKTGASKSHIVHTRVEYNECVPASERKYSKPLLTAPKEGTDSRIVYDYMILYPNARLSEVVADTGLSTGLIGKIRHMHFRPKSRENGVNKNLKSAIIDMIEKRYDNGVIAETLDTVIHYVGTVRSNYNSYVPEHLKKNSKRVIPATGTARRQVYDYLLRNPDAKWSEIRNAIQGIDNSVIHAVKRRYFAPKDDLGRDA